MNDFNLQENTMYYIQNGYVGNAILWWAESRQGYTSDIRKAEKFTKEETEKIITRPQDIAWPCDYIDNLIDARKVIIDSQYMDPSFRRVGLTK